MPGKNVIRQYTAGGFYHVYNRGVNKRDIFTDREDYVYFLGLLKRYLQATSDLHAEVDLVCYCLMPNHFHLLIRQNSESGITEFLRRVITSYVIYFNKKYNRVGTLFQGKFKAILIDNDSYLAHLSRYIHLNPNKHARSDLFENYVYSSYRDYVGVRNTEWLRPELVFDTFGQENNGDRYPKYEKFVKGYQEEWDEPLISNFLLEF